MSLLSHWISRKFSFSGQNSRRARREGSSRRRWAVEQLESRRLLAITVSGTTNLVFTGDGMNGPDALQIQISQQQAGGLQVNYTGTWATGNISGSSTGVTSIAFNDTGAGNSIEIDDLTGSVNAQTIITVDEANAADQVKFDDGIDPALATTFKNVQIVHVFDNSPVPPATVGGGDVIAVKSTIAAVTDTTVGSTSGAGGDFIDVSSDAPTLPPTTGNNGNLSGIKGPLSINTGANFNLIVLSDITGTTAKTVTMTGTSITGFAPAPINYSQSGAGSAEFALVGSNAKATTFTVSGTIGPGNPVFGPSLTDFFGGTAGGNTFNIQGASSDFLRIATRNGDGNTINISSDAPTNTGNLAGITSSIIAFVGSGKGNALNVSNASGTLTPPATADNVTLANGTDPAFGQAVNRITGFTPPEIDYNVAAKGALDVTVQGANGHPTNFTVASTLGTGTTLTLKGGSGGTNTFNLQNSTADTLTVFSGDGNKNTVTLNSAAPALTGDLTGITSNVLVNFGKGNGNTLNVSNKGSTALPASLLLTNVVIGGVTYNQITDLTPRPTPVIPTISYSVAAGGKLAVNVYGSDAERGTMTVASTLGAGTTLTLFGGGFGQNEFDLQSLSADSVTVNTGNGNGNIVNISSDAPTNTGNLTGILSAVTVNGGTLSNTLVVGNIGGTGAAADTVTVDSTQVSGLTAKPIGFTEAAGGTLAVDVYGADAHSTTFNVSSTLGAGVLKSGNSLLLVGGAAGGNAFNIGSTAAANNGQLNKVGAAVTVNGGSGPNNVLEIDDHGSFAAYNYVVTSNSVSSDPTTPRAFAGVTFSNVVTMRLDGTEQANMFGVNPSPTTVYTINAYGPPPPGSKGDTLSLDFSGVLNPVLTKMAVPPGSNSYNGSWTSSNRAAVNFTSIESLPVSIVAYSVDASVSGQPFVKVLYANSDQTVYDSSLLPHGFLAYEPSYHGGVRVAVGYFDNSGQQEIAVAPGPGHAPIIKVFSFDAIAHATSPSSVKPLYQFQAYASSVNGGLNIAAGNIEGLSNNGTEIDDIVTVPSRGVSDVRVFNNIASHPATLSPAPLIPAFRDFTVWSPSFIGGSSVAAADLKGTGRAAVIVGSGSGMAPMIEAFDVTVAAKAYLPFRVITPFTPSFRGGVNVSAIGAGSGVATPLIVASQGNSGAPTVSVYNGATGALSTFVVPYTGSGSNAPVRTVAKVIGGQLFIYTAQQLHGQSDMIRKYDPTTGAIVDYIFENDPNFQGIFIG
jgi:hypothetical protein